MGQKIRLQMRMRMRMKLLRWNDSVPLSRQLTYTFMLILISTLLTTLFTWGSSLFYALMNKNGPLSSKPANYYELQIPDIYKFVDNQGEELLDPSFRPKLEEVIPVKGIAYQVVDLSGHILYGTLAEPLVSGPGDLIRKFGSNANWKGGFLKFYPVLGADEALKGGLILHYKLTVRAANPDQANRLALFYFGNLAAPFVYLALFTFIFSRRFGKRINQPIASLIEAAERIERQDLDFAIGEIGGARELDELGRAFEQMRCTLQGSLFREWRSEQERQEMVAAMAHDLRTPLTIIQGHVDGLLSGGPHQQERLKRYLDTIKFNTVRSIRLVEEMNEVSEVERPDFQFTPEMIELDPLIRQKAEEYSMLCENKGIRLHYEYIDQRNHSGPIRQDSHRLNQILDNLLTNSIRFTPRDGEIAWTITVQEELIYMEIHDSGDGFAEKDLHSAFNRFYQGDASRAAGTSHAGLGLYIVSKLILKLGGDIVLDNHPNGGAWIKLWFKSM